MLDVPRREDGRSRQGVVVDTRGTPLVVSGQLRDHAEGEAMHVPDLVEVVALGQGRGCRDSPLRIARNGPQIFDVRGEEQTAVIDVERVSRVREERKLHSRAHWMLVPGKWGVVHVEQLAPTDRQFVRG